MAFDTKTPASIAALVSDILTFAVASGGMTLAAGGAGTSGSFTQYALQTASGFYITLGYDSTSIIANTATAWSQNTALTSQTGACSLNAIFKTSATPTKAWLFGDGYSVHVVVNPTAAAYQHFSFGVLEKYGTYTGDAYVATSFLNSATYYSGQWVMPHGCKTSSASTYQNHVRVGYGGKTVAVNGSVSITGANNYVSGFAGSTNAGSGGTYGEPLNRQPNSYNGRAVIMPHQYFLGYDNLSNTAPEGWIPIGKISNSGYINIENLSAEDTVNTDWMVFPLSMKNPVSPNFSLFEVDTRNIGLAYKK